MDLMTTCRCPEFVVAYAPTAGTAQPHRYLRGALGRETSVPTRHLCTIVNRQSERFHAIADAWLSLAVVFPMSVSYCVNSVPLPASRKRSLAAEPA